MKTRLLFTGLVVVLMFSACHTKSYQNVDLQIQKTWQAMPLDPAKDVEWTFANGELFLTYNQVPCVFYNEDGSQQPSVTYTIDNNITNHYLYVASLPTTNAPISIFPNHIKKYLLIQLTDQELYLESIGENGNKGEYQFHFFIE